MPELMPVARPLIVVPTYNEAENIELLLKGIFAATEGQAGDALFNVLVVDDGSPDGTGKIVSEISKKDPRVNLLQRSGKMGLGTAYLAGFQWGLAREYDVFIEMDADFSHDPKYLPVMISVLSRADVGVGSRYVAGGGTVNWGLGRKIISRGGSFYARTILGVGIRDFTGGFNGWHRKVLDGIDLSTIRSDGYSFQIVLKYRAARAGFKIEEFPIIFEDRKVGQSKMSKKIVFEALFNVWKFR